MYRPFFITTIASLICTLTILIGVSASPKFTDKFLITTVGLVYLGVFITIIVLSIRDFKLIYKKRINLNLLLILLSTPLPLIGSAMVKIYFRVTIYDSSIVPTNGQTVNKRFFKYKWGKPARIEYYKKDTEDWLNSDQKFYKDSTWIYFNWFGDTTKIEIYDKDQLIRSINT